MKYIEVKRNNNVWEESGNYSADGTFALSYNYSYGDIVIIVRKGRETSDGKIWHDIFLEKNAEILMRISENGFGFSESFNFSNIADVSNMLAKIEKLNISPDTNMLVQSVKKLMVEKMKS